MGIVPKIQPQARTVASVVTVLIHARAVTSVVIASVVLASEAVAPSTQISVALFKVEFSGWELGSRNLVCARPE